MLLKLGPWFKRCYDYVWFVCWRFYFVKVRWSLHIGKRARRRSVHWFQTGELSETHTGHNPASSSPGIHIYRQIVDFLCSWNVCTLTENGVCLLHECIPQRCNERVWPIWCEILSAFSSPGKSLASRLQLTESILCLPRSLHYRLLSFGYKMERLPNIDYIRYVYHEVKFVIIFCTLPGEISRRESNLPPFCQRR